MTMAEGQAKGLSHEAGKNGLAHPSGDAVRLELQLVLASPEFRASKRCQDFLSYVVEAAVEGRGDSLKERTIGVDVFARSASYDPSDDATVRVKAGEVRKRLGLYYTTEGAGDKIRIDLPPGAYVPHFRFIDFPDEQNGHLTATPVVPPELLKPLERVPVRGLLVRRVSVTLLAILVSLGAFSWQRTHSASVLDQFWAPVLAGTSPVSLCVAFVPVYASGSDPVADHPPQPENLTLLNDQFVGGGDLMAVSRLSSMLTRIQRPYHVLMGSNVSFHDLRTGPAILVGYSYTRWKNISKELRFFIDISRPPMGITDNGKPTAWNLPNLRADRHTDEDYALVSRVFHPDTGAMLVEVAGITQYGTEAAADMVTNPALMVEALQGAPAGWQKKNLQLVLHLKVISGTPASPRVVAKYFW